MTPARGGRPAASVRLDATLALVEPALRAATARLWHPDGLTGRYRAYLAAMHMVIRASVPLMERAAVRARRLERSGDPLGRPLAAHLAAHIEEERDHDAWLLDDLVAAGSGPDAALGAVPPPDVAALTGAQYYWIEHHHPVALLGYVTVLEGHAPAAGLADRLARLTGLPDAAFRTVRAHAQLDGGHVAGLRALLDALPLTRAQEAAVAVSALHTMDALTQLFVRLGRGAPAPGPGRGAGRPVPTGGRA
ncbi:iron-containing redox enzyme family protein [Streptomyces sp. LP05-1]|uniref:Iron-containing redox enzyme family protein n=1 Tax=Streptomyces pyxinae TaxID=2970734 RepID=A0ABT2CH15_9ACTN|nr:iron-containing redox enzyme family protein [Streptomyces sp. LP05-1]MCS0636712.1 iron-containing redox enzyme family protein [Streptomyces sp. LP05-1]